MADKNKKKGESKISNTEWGIVIGILVIIDLIQIGLNLAFQIGVVLNRFIDIPVGMAWTTYLYLRGVDLNTTRILSIGLTFFLEEIPDLDSLPFWSADGIVMYLSVKAEKELKAVAGVAVTTAAIALAPETGGASLAAEGAVAGAVEGGAVASGAGGLAEGAAASGRASGSLARGSKVAEEGAEPPRLNELGAEEDGEPPRLENDSDESEDEEMNGEDSNSDYPNNENQLEKQTQPSEDNNDEGGSKEPSPNNQKTFGPTSTTGPRNNGKKSNSGNSNQNLLNLSGNRKENESQRPARGGIMGNILDLAGLGQDDPRDLSKSYTERKKDREQKR